MENQNVDKPWSLELVYSTIINNSHSLESIPMHLRDRTACLIALYYKSTNILHVPDELQSEFSNYAFSLNYTAFEHIKDEYKTKDMCEEAVLHDGMLLKYVPHQWRDMNICSFACQNDVKALQFVPDAMLANEKWLMHDILEMTEDK